MNINVRRSEAVPHCKCGNTLIKGFWIVCHVCGRTYRYDFKRNSLQLREDGKFQAGNTGVSSRTHLSSPLRERSRMRVNGWKAPKN